LALAVISLQTDEARPDTADRPESDSEEEAIRRLREVAAQQLGVRNLKRFLPMSYATRTQPLSIQDLASASSATEQAKLRTARDAQRDLSMFSQLRLSELFVRTFQSQWLLGRGNMSGQLDNIAILPKSVGKEGSLVDAARRLCMQKPATPVADAEHLQMKRPDWKLGDEANAYRRNSRYVYNNKIQRPV
jgi:hypothetical protein